MPELTLHHAHWPAGVPLRLPAPESGLFSQFAHHAQRAPDQTAIDYYGRRISYRALHQAALSLAGYMQQRLNVRRGDRVLIMMQNCPQFAIAYYAILRCDAVVVSVSPMSSVEEIRHYVQDSGARVLVTMQDLLERVEPFLADGHLLGAIVGAYADFAGQPRDVPFMQIPAFVLEPRRAEQLAACRDPLHDFAGALAAGIAPTAMTASAADLAVIGYTSGTTGKPKGAMLSHQAFALVVTQRSLWFSGGADCSDLVILPISHVAGMGAMNQSLCEGRTMVLLARWDAAAVPALIEQRRIDRWAAVTPMLVELLSRSELDQHDISSLKCLYGGATAMPEAVAAQVRERFGVPFIECYGMTETCGSTHINPPQAPRLQCGGIAQINVDARIIDPATGAELGVGQAGEIVMHCPFQFEGYWNQPEANALAFIEIEGKRFVRSGDIGHYDENGYFYITDRLKRMINASGLKVWPAEIEACLFGHPAVQEACVISARDAHRGETVKVLVVCKPGTAHVSAEEIIEWTRTRLAAYKVPRQVEFVDVLPKTPAGKLMWRVVQDQQNESDRRAHAPAQGAAVTV